MTPTRGKRPVNMRLALLICAALAVPFSHLIGNLVPWINELELKAYDYHIKALPPLKPDSRLAIVGMDDPSLARLFQRGVIDRPAYTRAMQANLVRELHRAGAKAIVFDVYYTEAAPPQETLAFASALRETGNVTVALKSGRFSRPNGEGTTVRFTEPVPEIRPYVRAGSILFPRSAGNSVRWFNPWPADTSTTQRCLHLSVAAVSSYFGEADQGPYRAPGLSLGKITRHLSRNRT